MCHVPCALLEQLSTAGAWQVKHGRVDCKHGGRAATNKEPARTVPSSYPVPSPGVVTWSITVSGQSLHMSGPQCQA
ncbi:hypothetical protein QJQ45_023249 [Haematococcus lacustris]|nr:hypothetical protein QJQ45_023249 [Haematococcus lacustris]